jgi:hypothetical protein
MFILRPLADTIPAVTVEVRLKGLPTANTHSPILTEEELPIVIAGKLSASIFNTAKSDEGSVPIILA